ncbi:MAG: aminoacetone oxidase family FAD-binding enzyme [Eubacterium sp.]|nr:aminoacetone oxidase family FAD-binding enzyme [Eubacterium sp.]
MEAVIIGGGASGIACAIRLKQNMPSCGVTVLEQLDEPCKKLYATGNGRCNITNTAAGGYELTSSFFSSIGLVLRESNEGRVYPYSNQAASVVNILLGACEKLGVKIVTDANVYKAEKIGEQFNVFSKRGIFVCDALVLATGGKAQSALGSNGSGYKLAKSFNHTVTELSPALVQLTSSNKNCRALKGIRTKCGLSIDINGERKASSFGELLFTDYGISGIVTMDLSKNVSDVRLKNKTERCIAVIDFIPDMSEDELLKHINSFGSLEGLLPAKLCSILSRQAEGSSEKIAKYAKNWKIIITGTKGYDYAQITAGGVSNGELGEYNDSRLTEGLYIVGELTDNQFRCGGFNLDYAFSSGIAAADGITKVYDKN